MNLRDLVLQTRDLLAEARTPDQWTEAQVRRDLEAAQMDFVLRNPSAFPHLLRTFSGTTVNGTTDYKLPTDFLAFQSAELNALPCKQITRKEAWYYKRAGAFGASTLDPVVEVISASTSAYPAQSQVRFTPTPDSTTPPYVLWYWKRPQSLFQQVAVFEDTENWTGAGVTLEANTVGPTYPAAPVNIDQYNQKEQAIKNVLLTAGGAGTITAAYVYPAAVDFGADTTDVVELWINTNKTNVTDVRIQFHTTAATALYAVTVAPTAFAANGGRIRVPKSQFTTTGSPAWTSIAEIRLLLTASGAATVRFDDWRIYRTPEFNPLFHPALPYFAAASALAGDEGWTEKGDAHGLFATYVAMAERYIGGRAA